MIATPPIYVPVISDLISNILYLLILTNKGVLLINALTGEAVSYYDTGMGHTPSNNNEVINIFIIGTTHHLLLSTGNFKVISTNEVYVPYINYVSIMLIAIMFYSTIIGFYCHCIKISYISST